MTPPRRPARPPSGRPARQGTARRKPKRRGGRRWLRVLLVLMAIGAVGVGGLAAYMGFVPGLEPARVERLLADLTGRAESDAVAAAADPADGVAVPFDPSDPLAPANDVVTASDSAAGDLVFRDPGRCVACHGALGEGVPGLGPSLRDTSEWVGNGSLASIRRIIGSGAPATSRFRIAMPAYGGQLTNEDVERVAAFVYALAHPGRAVADSAGPDTLPAAGAANATVPDSAQRP